MARFVSRITVVNLSGPQGGQATTLYKKKGSKKRKVSTWLRPLEQTQRRMLRAADAWSGTSLSRHNRSARKRRDRWLTDVPVNQMRAFNKAFKKLRLI